jgi:hypothetical protein
VMRLADASEHAVVVVLHGGCAFIGTHPGHACPRREDRQRPVMDSCLIAPDQDPLRLPFLSRL